MHNENRIGEVDDEYRGISMIPPPAPPRDRWSLSCDSGRKTID